MSTTTVSRMRRRAALGAATACVALGAPASAAIGSTSTSAAKKCAHGTSVHASLSSRNYAVIKGFVLCLGRQWTVSTADKTDAGTGAGGYRALSGFSNVIGALNAFGRDPKADDTSAFILSRLRTATAVHTSSCYAYVLGDTAPPALTLAAISSGIVTAHGIVARDQRQYKGGFLRTTVVVQRGTWFHHGGAANVRYAVVFSESDPRTGNGNLLAC